MHRSKSHNISYLNNALFCFLVLADAMFSDFLICDLGHFASSQLISLVALPSLLNQDEKPIFYVNDTEGYSKPMHCSSDVKLLLPVLVSLWCKNFTTHVLAESYFLLLAWQVLASAHENIRLSVSLCLALIHTLCLEKAWQVKWLKWLLC